jgi:putative membrane protein
VFIFLIVILGGVLGAVLPNFSDPIKRLLVARQYQDVVTRQCAENAFLEEEVFNTRQRTGIMIFISFFEHEVIVMADQGISKVVDQKQWDMIVQDIIKSIRSGKIVEALENGIKQCGDILLEKGFRKTEDDTNELHDDLRV